jgi:uncharacterized protein (DUF302 family)
MGSDPFLRDPFLRLKPKEPKRMCIFHQASVSLWLSTASKIQESFMFYIAETEKSFETACHDLEIAVKEKGFGVLHIHNLGETLRSKGVTFNEQCRVFEVCNPHQAAKVMASDMRLNMALPCRISVYTEGPKTFLGMIKPTTQLNMLSEDDTLQEVAAEVEIATIDMIDSAT